MLIDGNKIDENYPSKKEEWRGGPKIDRQTYVTKKLWRPQIIYHLVHKKNIYIYILINHQKIFILYKKVGQLLVMVKI